MFSVDMFLVPILVVSNGGILLPPVRPCLLRFARWETDTNTKCKDNHDKCDTCIQTRVVYVEHCARWGELLKPNQAITSNSIPNVDPLTYSYKTSRTCSSWSWSGVYELNIMETTSNPTGLGLWSSDTGTEILHKWFSIPKVSQYFHTLSPVTMVDIDGRYAWSHRYAIF